MNLSDTFLYYPFIQIPESTLVHSLLFQDRIKRIIPPQDRMDEFHQEQAQRPNDICRQYLGYEFIESSDYWVAKESVADSFCNFLDEAKRTKNPQHFEPLLGENYQQKFIFNEEKITIGTQYLVYAHKFSNKVFTKLGNLDWMRHDEDMQACELTNELCNVYMSLLAACMSKVHKEPISTGLKQADDNLRSSIFREFFSEYIPQHIYNSDNYNEICINFILGQNVTDKGSDTISIDKVLTFPEAVRVRCGLEKERKDFSILVNDITDKARACNLENPNAFLSLEVKDTLEKARDYIEKIKTESRKQVSNERKAIISRLKTGLSASFPVIGVAADTLAGNSPAPGFWTATGTAIGLSTFFKKENSKQNQDQRKSPVLTSRQNAYLFMNRLWEIQDNKLSCA